ncbi:MAG: ABC transporter ATP-binding protein/permease [Candidatus Tectomicrobia bacterium]|nr:ABC transporter ATP-binding protein/permease [Candidatus Tectomicrobia bacterium]
MILELVTAAAAIYGVASVSKKPRHLGQLLAQQAKPDGNAHPLSQPRTSTTLRTPHALESPVSQRPRHPILRLLKVTHTKPKHLIVGGLVSVAGVFAHLLPMLMLTWLFKVILLGRSALLVRLGFIGLRAQLSFVGAGLLLAYGIDILMEKVQRKKWHQLSRAIEHRIHVQTVSHVQHLDLAHVDDQRSGRLMQIISDDAGRINRFFQYGVNDGLQPTFVLLSLGTILFFLSPMLTLLALLPQPLIIAFARRMQNRTAPPYRDLGDKTDDLHHLLTNNLAGLPTVRSFTAEDFEIDRITTASEVARQGNIEASTNSSNSASLIRFLFMVNFGVAIISAGALVLAGGLAQGAFILVASSIGFFMSQTREMGDSYDLYKQAIASAERILNLLETPISIRSGPYALPLGTVRGDITFDQVGFAYDPGVKVLEGFSLHLEAQESLALVGATGCGKTTLVKLLLRFYDVNSGAIRVDGVDIRELHLPDLRAAIGLISQDIYLFHGTVYDNIVYGRRDACFDEVVLAARVAEAHDFIESLPQGYDTIIGERGQKLSGGQRQRLAIARAVLKNPPILVLDEATSALDNETEAAIQRSLDRLSAHRTTITIAHRLSTVRHADRICVIEGGRVREQGRHDELLSQGGVYAALWGMQTGDVDTVPGVLLTNNASRTV